MTKARLRKTASERQTIIQRGLKGTSTVGRHLIEFTSAATRLDTVELECTVFVAAPSNSELLLNTNYLII